MSQVEFGSLFQFIRNGMNVKQDKSGNGLPITRIETISEATVDANRVGYAGLSDKDCSGWLLEQGDILFSHINSLEHIGKCAIYEGSPNKLIHGMNLLCLRCDQSKLLPEFAKYLIRGAEFRARLANFINKAVNQASVSIGNLKSITVSVPALHDQRRIAAILDQADALRSKRRETLAHLDSLAQSIFIEMFGNPLRNPMSWPNLSLKELGRITTGRTPPSSGEGMFDGDIPFVTPGDLDSGIPIKRSVTEKGAAIVGTVREGATLVCCIGTVGKLNVAVKRSAFNQQINAIEWGEEISDCYGLHALTFFKKLFMARASHTTVPILNKSKFEEIEIPVPPLDLQNEFDKKIASLKKIKLTYLSSTAEFDQLFISLESRAFKGLI